MNIYLKAYLRNNLGDDLFIKTICDRYKDVTFHILTPSHNSSFEQIKNLKIHYRSKISRTLDKIFRYLGQPNRQELKIIKNCDRIIYIGGSIFIQKQPVDDKYRKKLTIYKTGKPYHIMGFNIGPYYDEEYIDCINEEVFQNAASLSLRDKKSYSLVQYKENAICAPDIMFSAIPPKKNKVERQYAVISVVDMAQKSNEEKCRKYCQYITSLCAELRKANIHPILMSFCQHEGDEEIVQKIKEATDIDQYIYRGNIEEAESMIRNSCLVFGSRFHACVLAISYGVPLIPFAYSKKTDNMLNDLGYKGTILNIDNLNSRSIKKLISDSQKTTTDINIKELRKQSERHFFKLDEVLGK